MGTKAKVIQKQEGFVAQLNEVFRHMPLRRFSTKLAEPLQAEVLQKGKKPAMANRLIATIKHMFAKAVEWDMVESETLKKVRMVNLLEESNKRLKLLSAEAWQGLIDACNPHLGPIVIVALNTGMRKSEILQLKYWIQPSIINEVHNYCTVKGLQVSMQLITP